MRLSEYTEWLDKNPCLEVGGPSYCMNLYALADGIAATKVLEIGTGWGCSTSAFSASLSKRPGSSIVTVDMVNRVEPKCKRIIAKSGVNVKYVTSRFEDFTCEFTPDLIYIDTDWTEQSMNECRDKFYGCLRPGGLFILDGMFGQFGPTAFVRNSKLSFCPMQYSDSYAHAVNRKEPWPYRPSITYASCMNCQWSCGDWDENEIVKRSNEHHNRFMHVVVAGYMQLQLAS